MTSTSRWRSVSVAGWPASSALASSRRASLRLRSSSTTSTVSGALAVRSSIRRNATISAEGPSHTPRAAAIAGASSTNATRSWAGPPSVPLAVAASGCIRSLSDCSSTSDNPQFWGVAPPEIADWQRRSRSPRWTVAGERGPAPAGERRTTTNDDAHRRTGRARQCREALTTHGQTVPGEVVIDRATNEGDGVCVHASVGHLDRYAFGVTKVKGFAGRYLDLDLDDPRKGP